MSIFVWSDKYTVNVRLIDTQHQQLVSSLNALHDAMVAGKGKEVMGGILDNLIAYTRNHFMTEEGLLRSNGYPDFEGHRLEHEKLTAQVVKFQEDYRAGRTTMTIDVMNFLKDWLSGHIQGTDRKYSGFLNGKGVR